MKHSISRGFTLVELIITMVLVGIVGGMISTVVSAPIKQYFDAQRRAQLSNAADVALRSLARDVRSALPNSIRVKSSGSVSYLEFMGTVGGGRYRARSASSGVSDALDFTATDTGFDVLGVMPTIPGGASIVIMNMGAGTGADAYAGNNIVAISSSGGGKINFLPFLFPFESPSARFFVVTGPVTYACDTSTGRLTRYAGYAPGTTQPTPPSGGVASVVIDSVSACTINYDAASGRTGIVTVSLSVSSADESIRLFNQIAVRNTP
jgi:MSHA biogenesis protein MshO